jgi:hypothetical protein
MWETLSSRSMANFVVAQLDRGDPHVQLPNDSRKQRAQRRAIVDPADTLALASETSLSELVSGMPCGRRPTTRMPWGASSADSSRVSASLAACTDPSRAGSWGIGNVRGNRHRFLGGEPPVPSCLPVGRQRGPQRHLSQAWLHLARTVRGRVSEGQHHAMLRLAAGSPLVPGRLSLPPIPSGAV